MDFEPIGYLPEVGGRAGEAINPRRVGLILQKSPRRLLVKTKDPGKLQKLSNRRICQNRPRMR